MRIFMNQANTIYTDQAVDAFTKEIQTGLTLSAKLYDQTTVVTDSSISLPHTANGVYKGIFPQLVLVEKHYDIEVIALDGAIQVYYFKGPIAAITRKDQNV